MDVRRAFALLTRTYHGCQESFCPLDTDLSWMSGSASSRNHRREARTRAEELWRVLLRAPPERVRRAFALLTRTYHGGRQLLVRPGKLLKMIVWRGGTRSDRASHRT